MQISVEVSETERKSRRKIERTAKIIRDNTIDNPNEVFNDNNDKAAMNINDHENRSIVDEPGDPSLDTLDGMDSFLSKQEQADRKKALKKERKLSKQKSSEDSSRYSFLCCKASLEVKSMYI